MAAESPATCDSRTSQNGYGFGDTCCPVDCEPVGTGGGTGTFGMVGGRENSRVSGYGPPNGTSVASKTPSLAASGNQDRSPQEHGAPPETRFELLLRDLIHHVKMRHQVC